MGKRTLPIKERPGRPGEVGPNGPTNSGPFGIFKFCPIWRKIPGMTRYLVQYTLPVDNPVSNVSMRRGKDYVEFLVPLNHPDAHNMGFQDLLSAQQLSGLFHLSPTLKNKRASASGESSKIGRTILAGHKPINELDQKLKQQ